MHVAQRADNAVLRPEDVEDLRCTAYPDGTVMLTRGDRVLLECQEWARLLDEPSKRPVTCLICLAET